jgi:lipooligosaccharide transport system ATP-binding protein
MSSALPVVAKGLVKRFGDFTAVDGIDVEVAPGEAFGFLGPNGAGKSSTMRMIGCVSPVTEGELRIFGLDPGEHGREIRARLGVVPQADHLDGELTVEENLIIYGRYFDIPRAECRRRAGDLLDFVQLRERSTSRVEPLSGGMKRRLSIARSLINEPELLLLDEPTASLDPDTADTLRAHLEAYQARTRATVLLASHHMGEVERLAHHVLMLKAGRLVDQGSPDGLIARYGRDNLEEVFLDIARDRRQPAPASPS